MIEERQLTLIMENKPGALVRVVGLFHQRGYNIESLHVEPINDFKPYKFIEDELLNFCKSKTCILDSLGNGSEKIK